MPVTSLPLLRSASDRIVVSADLVGQLARERAAQLDNDFSFPEADVTTLHRTGLLLAPFPLRHGGDSLACGPDAARMLGSVLRRIGSGSLSLGRLYEGHVNAAGLVMRYGRPEQILAMSEEAAEGQLFGVWNTDDSDGLALVAVSNELSLRGRKILCSGAGFIERPLVTARDAEGRLVMVIPIVARGKRGDLSSWTPQGMRASATGSVDLTGVVVRPDQIIGGDGDYQRQPMFSGGAWRFAAVHIGGMEALLDLLRAHLNRTGRGNDPYQSARLGEASIAVETARLWVERAAILAETSTLEADAIVAYVNMARLAVERSGLDVLELVHRSIGLASFMRPNPIERISRDLATYLRQPAPDRALSNAATWVLASEHPTIDLWS